MPIRVPVLCLLALAVGLAGPVAAKPPDLPDNPPVIVQPHKQAPSLPLSIWLNSQQPMPIFPPAPEPERYELTLSPMAQRFLMTAMLYNTHPFVSFIPQEHFLAKAAEEAEQTPDCGCCWMAAMQQLGMCEMAQLAEALGKATAMQVAEVEEATEDSKEKAYTAENLYEDAFDAGC